MVQSFSLQLFKLRGKESIFNNLPITITMVYYFAVLSVIFQLKIKYHFGILYEISE